MGLALFDSRFNRVTYADVLTFDHRLHEVERDWPQELAVVYGESIRFVQEMQDSAARRAQIAAIPALSYAFVRLHRPFVDPKISRNLPKQTQKYHRELVIKHSSRLWRTLTSYPISLFLQESWYGLYNSRKGSIRNTFSYPFLP